MQIWLGKQWLAQTDKIDNTIDISEETEDALSVSLRELAKKIDNDQ